MKKLKRLLIILIVLLATTIGVNTRLEHTCEISTIETVTLLTIGMLIGAIISVSTKLFRDRGKKQEK